MKVPIIVQPPSLAAQLEGKSNLAISERMVENAEKQVEESKIEAEEKSQYIDILV